MGYSQCEQNCEQRNGNHDANLSCRYENLSNFVKGEECETFH